MPAEASAHPGVCRAGSDIVEWLMQKYSIAEDGKGSSVLFLRPTRPWGRGQARWLLPPLRIHRLASQRPCTWAASSCSTATSTRCATPAASSSGPMRRPIDSRSAWTGSRWGAPLWLHPQPCRGLQGGVGLWLEQHCPSGGPLATPQKAWTGSVPMTERPGQEEEPLAGPPKGGPLRSLLRTPPAYPGPEASPTVRALKKAALHLSVCSQS